MSRVDDVIRTSGTRITTGSLEEAINTIPYVVESAVVGMNDPLREQIPVAFIVLTEQRSTSNEDKLAQIKTEVNEKVMADVGTFAELAGVIIVKRLPKTRSGRKIVRRTIRKIVNEEKYRVPSTIEDPACIDEIKEAF